MELNYYFRSITNIIKNSARFIYLENYLLKGIQIGVYSKNYVGEAH